MFDYFILLAGCSLTVGYQAITPNNNGPQEKSLICLWASCALRNNISWLAVAAEAAEEALEQRNHKILSRALGRTRGLFFGVHFSVTHRSTAIYFNDVNKQGSRVGLLKCCLILPGGNMRHQGWPSQPALWKDNAPFSSLILFTFAPV